MHLQMLAAGNFRVVIIPVYTNATQRCYIDKLMETDDVSNTMQKLSYTVLPNSTPKSFWL